MLHIRWVGDVSAVVHVVGTRGAHAPLNPMKMPTVSAAVSCTDTPCEKDAEHVGGQSIPAGWLVTRPPAALVPWRTTCTDSTGGALVRVNVFVEKVVGGGPLLSVTGSVSDCGVQE